MKNQGPSDNSIIDLELAKANRPSLTKPSSPAVERVGLHYEASYPDRLHFKLDHLVEHREEFTGELTIRYETAGMVGGVLCWGRINLLSIQSRNGLVKQLKEKVDADWNQFIDPFCKEVVRMEREGNPIVEATEHVAVDSHQYLLDPILPLGLPTVLYGPGGVGKSTLACAMAFSIQTGIQVVGGWKPLTGPVMILDWEGREEDWTERWQQVAKGAGIQNFPAFLYRACKRRLRDDAEYLAEEINKHRVALVIVDSVSLAFGTSSYAEADPADMALRAFAAIRELGDVTWLLIDHVTGQTTNNDEVSLKAYGSVKKRDLARQMFHVAGAKESTDDRQELVITHTKANYSARLSPTGLVISRQDDAITFERSQELSAPELVEKLSMNGRIRTLLNGGAMTQQAIRDRLGIDPSDKKAKNTYSVAVTRLLQMGAVVRIPGDMLGLPLAEDGTRVVRP